MLESIRKRLEMLHKVEKAKEAKAERIKKLQELNRFTDEASPSHKESYTKR